MKAIELFRRMFFKRIGVNEELYSLSLRDKFQRQGRTIGLYSYGCFDINRIGKNTRIGRYCSFADTARVYTRNHGVDYISTTPFLYNSVMNHGFAREIEHVDCVIEDDVWMGHNAIVLPGAKFVGRGAVIGAGAVVTKPVERYAVVVGNPARVARYRFSPGIISAIENTEWWNLSIEELRLAIRNHPDMIFKPSSFFS